MVGKSAVQCKQVIVHLCSICGATIVADTQFCRQCGAAQGDEPQTDGFSSQVTVTLAKPNDSNDSLAYETTVLTKEFYQEVSIPLIDSATDQLISQKTEHFRGGWGKRLLVALLLVPI